MPQFLLLLGCLVLTPAEGRQLQIPPDIQTLLDAHKYSEAEQAIQSRLNSWPDWEAGHLVLGQIYNATGRYALAERAALSAIRIRQSVDGFMVLGVATMRLQKVNESIRWLQKAVNFQPDLPDIYKVLGLDYALAGMLEDSEKAFLRGVELAPQNWEFHYLRGRALYELKMFRESAEALRQAIALNGNSAHGWTALGQTQESLYDLAAAEKSYQRALEVCSPAGSECAWPLLQLGFLASREKGMREAEKYFRRAITARPNWAKPHFYLGKTLANLGDLNGARLEMETALSFDETRPEYHYQLAQVLRRLGQARRAEQQMARHQALTDLEGRKKASADFISP